SNSFPIVNPMQSLFNGSNDVFVTKLDPSGTSIIYSTYVGSLDDERATGIAVDAEGNAYVTGFTASRDFPLVDPLQAVHAGGGLVNGGDTFLFRLNADGSALTLSTFLGGSGDDWARSLALDGAGNIYLAGFTTSQDFPLAGPFQGEFGGGTRDAFVAKLGPNASSIVYASYWGGSGVDELNGIVVDGEGNAYVAGHTTSRDLPTANPLQADYGGGTRDVIVARINAAGDALVYATYIGGGNDDFARGLAVDAQGQAHITGYSTGTGYPRRNALQQAFGGSRDAFITKLNAEGSAMVYSTFLGGASPDEGFSIAVDERGFVYLAGITMSLNFPLVEAVQRDQGLGACTRAPCTNDVFVAKLDPEGMTLLYSTYLGGAAADVSRSIAVDAEGSVVVTGNTASTNFPLASPYQGANPGGGSAVAFVTKIGDN
ncbi:MAG: SBBP repeat-containing protein, partial [Bryobacteraceae bacterium]